MKIDNNRASFDRIQNAAAEAAQKGSGKAGRAGAVDGGDQVRLSSGAQFATSVVSAAASAPDLRQDRIDRARELIDSGRLGSDPHTLADALIDRAIADRE